MVLKTLAGAGDMALLFFCVCVTGISSFSVFVLPRDAASTVSAVVAAAVMGTMLLGEIVNPDSEANRSLSLLSVIAVQTDLISDFCLQLPRFHALVGHRVPVSHHGRYVLDCLTVFLCCQAYRKSATLVLCLRRQLHSDRLHRVQAQPVQSVLLRHLHHRWNVSVSAQHIHSCSGFKNRAMLAGSSWWRSSSRFSRSAFALHYSNNALSP
jgi:hypothetical protein